MPDIREFQAGAYEQRYEYKAFLPKPINWEWTVSDADLIDLLGAADRALGELKAFSLLIPDIDFFIRMHVAKEATQSSRIEGTQTNIEDAFKDERDIHPEERDDCAEVQNYIRAINFAIAELERLPLCNRLLRETHRVLMSGVRGRDKMPGEFRTSQNWIGVSLKNAEFVPPHHEHVPDLMSDLERFLQSRDIRTHPLLRIAIAHYQFETIHPFLDSNGRLGRLMISLYLASEGLLPKPALYLSDYLERNKTAYVDNLMAVREGNHMRKWLVFFLHGVAETAQNAAQVLQRILGMKQRIEQEILPRFSSRRQENVQRLMWHLYQQPVISVQMAHKLIGGTSNTAAALIRDLEKNGVLKEITGRRRNRLYVFSEYIGLFQDNSR